MHHRRYLFTRYHLASSGRAEKFSLKHFPPVLQSLYAQATALNIITAIESITHIALTTETVTGATEVLTVGLSAEADHVKIKRAGALVSNITHLSDWDISLYETDADRNSPVNRAIIGSQLHDWMVEIQTTTVAFMMYNGGDGLEVPIWAYAAENDTLHFHITPAPDNLTARNSHYSSHVSFFTANGAGIKLSMQNVIDRKSPPGVPG